MFKAKMRAYQPWEQALKTEIYKAVKQHWMQGLIIIGLCFIILKKDIQIQLNLSNTITSQKPLSEKPDQRKVPVKELEVKEPLESKQKVEAIHTTELSKLNQLAIIDPVQLWSMIKDKLIDKENLSDSFSSNETRNVQEHVLKPAQIPLAEKKTNKKSKTTGSAPVANNYSYLTFVLSPTYAKRNGVPQSIVDEKLNACRNYINRFAPVAVSERKKFGIPASIKLAQALLESNAGESRLSRKNNNHFGIKCFQKNCSKGHCGNFTDDSHKDFFRAYENNWESYRAHSLFLQGKRYVGLKELGIKDYKGWANGLKKAGYATDKKYAEKLIRIIEFFDLQRFDV